MRSPSGELEATIVQLLQDKHPIADIVMKLQVPFKKVRAVYMEMQFEVEDILPGKPKEVLALEIEKLRMMRAEKNAEEEKAKRERKIHEARLKKMEKDERELARRDARSAKIGTLNLVPAPVAPPAVIDEKKESAE